MVKRRDLNAPPGQRQADIVRRLRELSRQKTTGAHGTKDMGLEGDVTWPVFDLETGEYADRSVKDIDGDLEGAQGRIDEALAELEQAAQRLTDAEAAVEAADNRLDTVETVTIPNAVEALEAADAAAQGELSVLDAALATAKTDLATAKTNLTQLSTDLLAETAARAQLASDLAVDLGELDTALETAFPSGAFDVASELSRTIRNSVIQYAVGSSATTAPTTGWSTSSPTRTPGSYIWFRTVITYANDTTSTSSAALLTGNDGSDGDPGPKGDDGTSVKILGTKTSIANLPTTGNVTGDGWLVDGFLHVWTGSAWENVGKIQGPQGEPGPEGDPGAPGNPGAPGLGIASVTPYFKRQTSGTAAPTKPTAMTPSGWTATEPDWIAGTELYRTERVVYSNATFAYTSVTKVATFAGIDAAMAAANGKNMNTYTDLALASKPGPPPAVDLSRRAGDVHRNRYTATGEIWAEYQWTGTVWKPVTFGNEVLTSLDVGKLTAGSAAFQTAVIDKLWVDNLVGKTAVFQQINIASGNLFTDPNGLNPALRTGVGGPGWTWDDTGKYWKRASVQSGTTQFNAYLTSGNVYDSNLLEAGAMYAIRFDVWIDKVASNTGGRAAIYYRRIDGTTAFVGDGLEGDGDYDLTDPITTAGAWTTVERFWRAPADVSSGGINFQILNGAADSTEVRIRKPLILRQGGTVTIENGAVNASKVNAQSVAGAVGQFIELTTDQLNAGGAAIDTAVINKLWVDGLSAKAVTTSRLAVASGNAYKYASFWMWPAAGGTWSATGGRDGGGTLTIDAGTAQRGSYDHVYDSTNATPVTPNVTYRISVWVKPAVDSPNPALSMYWRWYKADGSQTGLNYVKSSSGLAGEWSLIEQERLAPADAAYAVAGFYSQSNYTGALTFSEPSVRPLVGSVLIEDGAVTTSKLTVTEEMAAELASFMSVETKNLIVTEAAILQHATLLGTTVVDQINVTGKLIGSDGVFTGTVDFSNINVTGEAILAKLATNSISADLIDVTDLAAEMVLAGLIRTGITGRRVEITGNGIRGWNDANQQTININGDYNFMSGRISTGRDGMAGAILTPTTTGGSGLWFSQDGSASGSQAAIYSHLDGNIHIRPKDSVPRGTVFIDGNLIVKSKASFAGNVDAAGFVAQGAAGRVTTPNLFLRNPTYVTTAPNVAMTSPGHSDPAKAGEMFFSTSSRRFKKDIKDWAPDPEAVLAMQPRLWHPLSGAPDEGTWVAGFIAEEIEELGLIPLVRYADEGGPEPVPDGLNYERFGAAQQVVLQKHEAEIQELRAENEDLRGRLAKIEALLLNGGPE